MVRIVPAAKIK